MAMRWSTSYECKSAKTMCAIYYFHVLKKTYPHDTMLAAGAVVGALCAGKTTHLIGHRYSIMAYDFFIFVASLMTGISSSHIKSAEMNVYFVLLGIGIGALCAALPSYIGEITAPSKRSRLTAMVPVFLTFGFFIPWSWSLVSCILIMIHAIGVFFIPESPYFLIRNGKNDEATNSLIKLRGGTDVSEEFTVIKNEVEQQHTFSEMLADRANRMSLFIGVAFIFFYGLMNINMSIYSQYFSKYMIDFYMNDEKDIKEDDLLMVPNIYNHYLRDIIAFIMALITVYLVEVCRRRTLCLISGALLTLVLAGTSLFMIFFKKDYLEIWIWILLLLFCAFFNLGFSIVPWIIIGEIFSSEVKPYGLSLAFALNWTLVLLVSWQHKFFITYQKCTFVIWTVFCLIGTLCVWRVIPETKNLSLTEIHSKLAKDDSSALETENNNNV